MVTSWPFCDARMSGTEVRACTLYSIVGAVLLVKAPVAHREAEVARAEG